MNRLASQLAAVVVGSIGLMSMGGARSWPL